MVEFILKCYEEYKIFMDLEPNILPNIVPVMKVHPEDENGKYPYAYINEDEIGNNPMNIYYDSKLSENRKDFIKALLFHEFTHILDGLSFKNNYDDKQLTALMTIYSEFHAAQIEMACKVGFRNIHSVHKINLDKTFVPCGNKNHKIRNDYIDQMGDSLVIIEKPNDYYYNLSCVDYFRYYKTFEAKVMYYLGKKNFCAKYSLKREPDIMQKSYGEFYHYIQKIEQCVLNKDFDNILECKNQLWHKYLSVFKLKEEELKILLLK